MSESVCPNCLSALEPRPEPEAPDALRCPVCQYAQRPCPRCGETMVKQVLPPADIEIEATGLPLHRCEQQWVCGAPGCGTTLDAAP